MHSSRVYFLITHRIKICPQTLNYACRGQNSASCRELAKPRQAFLVSPQRTPISPAPFQTFACGNNRICINKLKSIKSRLSPQFPSHTRQLEPKCRGCCGDLFFPMRLLFLLSTAAGRRSPSVQMRAHPLWHTHWSLNSNGDYDPRSGFQLLTASRVPARLLQT